MPLQPVKPPPQQIMEPTHRRVLLHHQINQRRKIRRTQHPRIRRLNPLPVRRHAHLPQRMQVPAPPPHKRNVRRIKQIQFPPEHTPRPPRPPRRRPHNPLLPRQPVHDQTRVRQQRPPDQNAVRRLHTIRQFNPPLATPWSPRAAPSHPPPPQAPQVPPAQSPSSSPPPSPSAGSASPPHPHSRPAPSPAPPPSAP